MVLRRYVTGAVRWALASLGAAASGALLVLGLGFLDADVGLVVGVGLYGTLAGMLQWLVLRGQVAGAGWWVPASTVGWLVALPVGTATGPPGWSVYGAISGTALVWLLRRGPA